jgi:hypothetical protein
MAKSAWQPTATDKAFPEKKSELTYKGITEWVALHGTEEDKTWLCDTVEQNTQEITFLKVDETKVKKAFCERMQLYQERAAASTKKAAAPAEKLRAALKVEKKAPAKK